MDPSNAWLIGMDYQIRGQCFFFPSDGRPIALGREPGIIERGGDNAWLKLDWASSFDLVHRIEAFGLILLSRVHAPPWPLAGLISPL